MVHIVAPKATHFDAAISHLEWVSRTHGNPVRLYPGLLDPTLYRNRKKLRTATNVLSASELHELEECISALTDITYDVGLRCLDQPDCGHIKGRLERIRPPCGTETLAPPSPLITPIGSQMTGPSSCRRCVGTSLLYLGHA